MNENDKPAPSQPADAVREDGARLDWMDANGFTAYRAIDPIDGLSGHCVVVHETQRPRRGNVADTIRQAIDQARGKGGGEVGWWPAAIGTPSRAACSPPSRRLRAPRI